MIILFVTK